MISGGNATGFVSSMDTAVRFHTEVLGLRLEVFADRWIAHTGKLDEFYSQLPAGTMVGVESRGNMLWFERRLAQYGHQLRLGDAANPDERSAQAGV